MELSIGSIPAADGMGRALSKDCAAVFSITPGSLWASWVGSLLVLAASMEL